MTKFKEEDLKVIHAAHLRLGDILIPSRLDQFERGMVISLKQRVYPSNKGTEIFNPYRVTITMSNGNTHIVWGDCPYFVHRQKAPDLRGPEDYYKEPFTLE